MRKRILFTFALLVAVVCTAMAQVTTSALSGKVAMAADGEPVIGATVQAVHEPSGTRYTTVTNVDGRYAIQGMRVGGPYKVSVSYIGYNKKEFTGITLQLGETYNLNAKMSEDASQLEEVVVSAHASKFAGEKTGASTNISQVQMQTIPTISRSISDLARLSPYANGMSFAGGDGRSTNFTLDGANLNNNFGLTSGLPGGGNPISMDAIDEMQVVVSPFDVRQTNFIGGGINAVTKSGTNTFKGSAYIYYNNENMHGNRVANTDLGERGTNRSTTYGFTLGGPIVKDKLFFFANAEYTTIPAVANRWAPSDNGKANLDQYISRTTKNDLDRVSKFLKEKYGYDPGSYTDWGADEHNLKLLGRLDWNINNNHHLALRFNHTANKAWNAPNGNSSDTGYRLRGMDRLSQYSMSFSNSMYSMDNKVSSLSADLNSRFSDKFANQLLFTYTDITDERGSNSSDFPFVDIMNGYETLADGTVKQDLSPYMSFGYELFSYNNRVQNKITSLTDNFTWYAGNHKVTAGFNFEHQLANNSYMRGGTGYYRYRSVDDFINGAAPETVGLAYGYNGVSHPNAEVKFSQYGLYLQDEWNVNDCLKLTGGIRFDNIAFDNGDIMTNNAIKDLDFGGRHIDTGLWPKANIQISPRVGFVWDVLGDKSLKVRGGTGLFAGRLPLVFFTNMPTNSGMIQQNPYNAVTTYNSDGTVKSSNPTLDKFKGGLVTDPNQIRDLLGAPASITPEQGTVAKTIGGVDRNFKMPQVWKTSVAVDYQVPVSFPLTLTAEFIYTKKINDVMLNNYNIKNNTSEWEHLNGADNRLIYPKDFTYYSNLNDACVLTNTHKGHGYTFNITATAEPIKNLNVMAAYTHTVMKEISGMPGSNASSAWSGLYTVNGPNFPTLQNSAYVIPDRLIASVSYKYAKEHFSLFYTGYSPAGYSFFYNGDVNGDGIKNDLMYIPKDDSEIQFASDADRQAFWQFVEQDKYLKNHKGEYAEAYGARAPFVHRFDFRWAHDFDVKIGNTLNRLQLSVDIMNVGNLFNSKWGVAKNMGVCNNGQILKLNKIENNTPVFSMMKSNGEYPTKTWDFNHNYDQCWKMQVGLKYTFN